MSVRLLMAAPPRWGMAKLTCGSPNRGFCALNLSKASRTRYAFSVFAFLMLSKYGNTLSILLMTLFSFPVLASMDGSMSIFTSSTTASMNPSLSTPSLVSSIIRQSSNGVAPFCCDKYTRKESNVCNNSL